MVKVRKRGEQIRQFILENLNDHREDIASFTAEKFKITRQAVYKHINLLISQGAITATGSTKDKIYSLNTKEQINKKYDLKESPLEEDVVWREDIYPIFEQYPENVINIWHYCFTEMFNNVIDHSNGSGVIVRINKTAINTEIVVYDNGIGIFHKIQKELNLLDERHAILELSKGKVTTDPQNHTGEGIFFTSRMMDDFTILSGATYYNHSKKDEDSDWIFERTIFKNGTGVFMTLSNNTSKTSKKIFDKFTATNDDYGFNKTIVPVNLVRYGDESLVSRSQAKRLLARVDRFKIVILDFEGINSIGQAFADEIFRVFRSKNRDTEIHHINANRDVEDMIVRALI